MNATTYILLGVGMASLAAFLILLVLIQRGRGGGLVGALGGRGGDSFMGARDASKVTYFTYAVAVVWILMCVLSLKLLHREVLASAPPPVTQQTQTDM